MQVTSALLARLHADFTHIGRSDISISQDCLKNLLPLDRRFVHGSTPNPGNPRHATRSAWTENERLSHLPGPGATQRANPPGHPVEPRPTYAERAHKCSQYSRLPHCG